MEYSIQFGCCEKTELDLLLGTKEYAIRDSTRLSLSSPGPALLDYSVSFWDVGTTRVLTYGSKRISQGISALDADTPFHKMLLTPVADLVILYLSIVRKKVK